MSNQNDAWALKKALRKSMAALPSHHRASLDITFTALDRAVDEHWAEYVAEKKAYVNGLDAEAVGRVGEVVHGGPGRLLNVTMMKWPPAGSLLFTRPSHTPTKSQIRGVFLANGFTIKEGHTDLKPYVYEAARALLALVTSAPAQYDEAKVIEQAIREAADRFGLERFARAVAEIAPVGATVTSSALDAQIGSAQAEVATWSAERRKSMRLEGGDAC